MASYTPNLNLYKPDDSDDYRDFREGFNDNMDILDQGGGGGGNQNIATDYDDTQTYTQGDYVIENGVLYKCVTAVTTPESFDPTKWTQVTVGDELEGKISYVSWFANFSNGDIMGQLYIDNHYYFLRSRKYTGGDGVNVNLIPNGDGEISLEYLKVVDGAVNLVFDDGN